MRKLYYFLPVLLCLWLPGRAQVVMDTASIEVIIERAFSELDFSDVTTGIMLDKVPRYLDYRELNIKGSSPADSIFVAGPAFPILYGMIDQSHTGVSPLEEVEDWWSTYELKSSSDTLKLGAMWYTYHRVKDDALTQNLIALNGDRFVDVFPRSASPYVQDTLFAASIMQYSVTGYTHTLHYDPALFYSNISGVVPTLEVDAGDGQGWRTIAPGGVISVTFPTDSVNLVQVRLPDSAVNDWYANTIVEVSPAILPLQEESIGGDRGGQYSASPNDSITDVNGVTLYIFYNQDCPELKLRKPLILVEGLDPDNRNDWRLLTNASNVGLLDFDYEDPNSILLKNYIHSDDYDLIYVDFHEGAGDLITNAQHVKAAIRRINEIKEQNGSAEKNVVVGASMGGVIGKWALREMELDEEDHETEKYITLDAPMKGANIPISLQALLRDLNEIRIFGINFITLSETFNIEAGLAAKKGWETVNSPAARQLLYYHISNCGDASTCSEVNMSTQHTTFFSQLDELGDLDIPEYAIINGAINGIGSEEFGPGSLLLDQNLMKSLWFKWIGIENSMFLDVRLRAVPGNSDGRVYRRQFVHIFLSIPFTSWQNFYLSDEANFLTLDSAPGGLRPFSQGTDDDIEWEYNAFSFIPTISSLSLNTDDPFHSSLDLTDIEDIVQSSTPLKSYIGATAISNQNGVNRVNQLHVTLDSYTAPNLRKLLNSLENPMVINGDFTDQYNFGESDYILENGFLNKISTPTVINEDMTILSGGFLGINQNNRIGDISLTTNPQSQIGETFEVVVGKSKCDGEAVTVLVDNGGIIQVGENIGSGVINEGHLVVEEESSLIIEDGGEVLVKNQSSVVVKEGAILEVRKGGILEPVNGAVIKIEDGAVMTIEDDGLVDARWGGGIDIEEDGEMIVKAGATIRLTAEYSYVKIQEGGKMTIEDGAIVQLWDAPNPDGLGRIEVRGELVVEGDFDLSGNGFFDFYDTHTLTLAGGKLNLDGAGKTVRLIRLNYGTKLDLESANINIKNARVDYQSNNWIVSNNGSVVSMENVHLKSLGSFNTGLMMHNYRRVRLENVEVSGFDLGVSVWENDGTFPVVHTYFTGCLFKNNKSALGIENVKQVYVQNSEFEGANQTGEGLLFSNVEQMGVNNCSFNDLLVGIYALDGRNRLGLSDSRIEECHYGIKSDFENAEFNLIARMGTIFEKNDSAIVVKRGGFGVNGDFGLILFDCVKLIDNTIGIKGKDLLLQIDAYTNSHSITNFRSNTFKCQPGQLLFQLCFDQRDVSITNAIPAW